MIFDPKCIQNNKIQAYKYTTVHLNVFKNLDQLFLLLLLCDAAGAEFIAATGRARMKAAWSIGSCRCQTEHGFIELQRAPELGFRSFWSLDPGILGKRSLRQPPRAAVGAFGQSMHTASYVLSAIVIYPFAVITFEQNSEARRGILDWIGQKPIQLRHGCNGKSYRLATTHIVVR